MKKITFIFCMICLTGFSQSNKVLGTFSAGCKVFNFDFTSSQNGLCIFKITDIDKDGDQIVFNKDSVKGYENNINAITNHLDSLSSILRLSDSLHPFIINVLKKYQKIIDKINADSADLSYWKNNKDSVKLILKASQTLSLERYDSALIVFKEHSVIQKFNSQLKNISNIITELGESKSYTLNEFKKETFFPLFTYLMNQRKVLFLPECSKDTNIVDIMNSVFYEIKTKLDFKDDEPLTAYLKLNNQKITCYYSNSRLNKLNYENSKKNSIQIQNKFIVENVSVEFEDGTMKNLFADLNLEDSLGNPIFSTPIRFKNTFPISISSKNDKDRFSLSNIYVSDWGAVKKYLKLEAVRANPSSAVKLKVEPVSASSVNDSVYINNIYFVLSDLIAYVDVLETDKEDYSPVNSVVNLNKSNTVQELRKEKRSKILTTRAFTDFVGVKGDQPNGLIQIEASRKFNFLTKKSGLKNYYFGLLTYIEPKLSFSKIEKNNNSLLLNFSNIDSLELSANKRKVFELNTLDLLKYQSSALDIDLNIYKGNIPNFKSNLQVNLNVGVLRTTATDSISLVGDSLKMTMVPNSNTLNTFRYGFSILYELKPDSRYGLTLGYDYKSYNLLSDDYRLNTSSFNVINSFWADAYLKTNDNSKLFFRYKISFVSPAYKQNFVQIQLGYLIDLFKTTK